MQLTPHIPRYRIYGTPSPRPWNGSWRTTYPRSGPHTYTKPWARLFRLKKKALKKYRLTKHPRDLVHLKKLQKAQRNECRKAYHLYLMGILDPDSGNKSKRLYSYVKSLKNDSCSVGPLRDKQGNLQSSAATRATLLNNQFASVFTSEDTTTLPKLSPSPYPDMNHITIHTNEVANMLWHIKTHKASGPDEIPACLLKEAADQLALMLKTIFHASYNQGTVPTACLQKGGHFQKGGPSGTFKLPPYIPHGHLLQTDGTHYAVQHNPPPW